MFYQAIDRLSPCFISKARSGVFHPNAKRHVPADTGDAVL
jgi:hypothetical protein